MKTATTILSVFASCLLAVCGCAAQTGTGDYGRRSQEDRSQDSRSQGNRSQGNHSQDNRFQENRWAKHPALNDVPDSASGRSNPFEGAPREAMAGGKLFQEHCADCHGAKGGGTRQGPPLLSKEVEQAKPGALFWVLTNGSVWHGMPVWSKLPEPERWQIVTFLEALNRHHGDSPGQ
jgi:mono/diheme cytochrome c family protein